MHAICTSPSLIHLLSSLSLPSPLSPSTPYTGPGANLGLGWTNLLLALLIIVNVLYLTLTKKDVLEVSSIENSSNGATKRVTSARLSGQAAAIQMGGEALMLEGGTGK